MTKKIKFTKTKKIIIIKNLKGEDFYPWSINILGEPIKGSSTLLNIHILSCNNAYSKSIAKWNLEN